MNDKDSRALARIRDYCLEIEIRIADHHITQELFSADSFVADALLMPLIQIGELAGTLSKEYKDSHEGIPWSEIIGFRNVIVHDYDGINRYWSWDTLQIDIPALKAHCEKSLKTGE